MPVVMGLPEPDVCAKMLGLAGATLIFTMATTGHVAARLMPGGGGGSEGIEWFRTPAAVRKRVHAYPELLLSWGEVRHAARARPRI